MFRNAMKATFIVAASVSPAMGWPITSVIKDYTPDGAVVDQVLSPDEYGNGNSFAFTGGGTGFGGTVGNGTMYLESDSTHLYIGFQFGGALNDLVAIELATRAGGFTDAGMNDNGDGCRRAISQLSINADDAFDPSFLPDFGVCLGNFGNVLFELTADPNALNFLNFDGTGSQPFREYAIPLNAIGLAGGGAYETVDFFAAYIADSGFGSNESIPAYGPLNSGNNPGFDPTSPGYGNFNRFITPEPTSLGLLTLALCGVIRRRR